MKKGQTVFVITSTQKVREGVLGEESTAQGFYTRWGKGHAVRFPFNEVTMVVHTFNDENVFCTEEDAKKEIFKRRLRYPQFYRGAA